jgi:putative glycerol-1-phosphate prenyltransferase
LLINIVSVLSYIKKSADSKQLLIAQLIDPDHIRDFDHLADIAKTAQNAGVGLFLFGGSLILKKQGFGMVEALKEMTTIPVVLFPSSPKDIDHHADAMLFLSLLSGRNPEYLIGHHVAAAGELRQSNLEIIPTGYLLVACGTATTAEYVSNTQPIPYNKPQIAASTALAGQMLGMQLIYLDGGSGADRPISPEMISEVRQWVKTPIIVGGGIKTASQAEELQNAGADVLIIGTAAEKNPGFIKELSAKIR